MRLATQPYSTKGTLGKRFVHLTNYSVNKKSDVYVKNTNKKEEEEVKEDSMASKWDFKSLKEEYVRMGVNYEQVFKDIHDVLIKTLISVEPHISANMRQVKNKTACFELYGFDVILD